MKKAWDIGNGSEKDKVDAYIVRMAKENAKEKKQLLDAIDAQISRSSNSPVEISGYENFKKDYIERLDKAENSYNESRKDIIFNTQGDAHGSR